jgi:TonB family protein
MATALVTSVWPLTALAQPAVGEQPAASAASIVPPRLASPADVAYPDGATGNATVVLSVTVNADGTVRSARVLEGEEPFASAALGAASSWRFEPAERGGRAVAATVRFEVSFSPPAPPPEAAPKPPVAGETPSSAGAPAAKSAPAAAPRAPPEPIDVVVYGEKLPPSTSSFTRAEVRQLPGAFGDPFRAIEAMPGVTPIVSGLPFFYVRGAPPGNVGYFLDGVRVPYLYHVGLGPSVVHPGMVDRVDLYSGGYPARFGRFAGGIVSGEVTAPRTDFHGEGNIRIFDLGAMAETGFAGGRGSVLLGGRYSYTGALLSLISPSITLDYRDYQARISYDLTPHDRVSAFSFGSYDLLAQKQIGITNILFGSEFYRLDLRYDHSFGTSSRIRTAVTLGYDQTRIGDQRNAQDRMVGARIELEHPLGERVRLRAGADTVRDAFTADRAAYADPEDPGVQRFNNLFPSRADLALGGWTDLVMNPTPELELTPGVRLDLFRSGATTVPAVDPRISARFKITDKFRIAHAYGLAHQPPSFVVPIPGLTPGTLSGGLQTSVQTSAGIEWDFAEATTATASVFYNAFFAMTDALGTISSGTGIGNALEQRSRGRAMGFELFVHRRLSQRLGGFLTYTLSRSMRTLGNATFPSAFDRTHVANAALAYDLGRNWRAGTRLVFYTGTPKIVSTRGLLAPPPSLSPQRNPPFYRVDLRCEKRWNLGERTWISFVMEVLNATLSKETIGSSSIGPVTIPSIGAEAGF